MRNIGGMAAHDSAGPAHTGERPSGRPTAIDVDRTGVSMSWKTALGIAGFIVAGAVAWTVFTASLATKAEASEHNLSIDAHPIVLVPGQPPVSMPRLLAQHEQAQAEMKESVTKLTEVVGKNERVVASVRNGFYEQRAEDLAYRIVDKLPTNTPNRQRLETFQRVKEQAKANLEDEHDIRQGLENFGW